MRERDTDMPPSPLDVLTASLADAMASKAKFDAMARRKQSDPLAPGYTQHADPFRDDYEPSEAVRHLRTKPLRMDVSFEDPLHTRRQLQILAAALVKAVAISQDHERGGYNQLADMRHVLRQAMQEIQHLRGKKTRPD